MGVGQMPVISVVIPVYNGEKTIRETVESVLKQTFTDFELLIIDDGSTDSTPAILSSFTDPRLQVLSYPNAGLAASRNRGISGATGQYISFIDADDLWTPDKLEAQLQALTNNPEAAVAYSWVDVIDDSSQWVRPGGHLTVNGNAYPYLLLKNFLENGSNALICKSAIDRTGNFDESLKASEDWDFYLRLAKHYPFVAVQSVQILYRESATSMSSQIIRQKSESLRVIDKAFSDAPESSKHLKKYSVDNMNKYLIFKCLEVASGR
ncbi:MAG: glycosyltransferase, partial [Limnospira sp.]